MNCFMIHYCLENWTLMSYFIAQKIKPFKFFLCQAYSNKAFNRPNTFMSSFEFFDVLISWCSCTKCYSF